MDTKWGNKTTFADFMSATTDTIVHQDRIIGKVENAEGPILVVLGGTHGNELAGLEAIRNVLERINGQQIELRGSFYGVVGNRKAADANKRFIDKDLNRIWDFDHFKQNGRQLHELQEREELYQFFKDLAGRSNQLFVIDLHTTSSSSSPFCILGDTMRNWQFAKNLPVPKVLGIEEQIGGTLSAYLSERGVVAINFEAGNHVDPQSTERHEAAIWLSLVSSGCLSAAQVPDLAAKQKLLRRSARGLPMVFESIFRYGITPSERYVMRPGFYNFKRVKKGGHLAYRNGSPVFAPMTGRIFMPLYQEQGDDGFFILHRIGPVWQAISEKLRKSKCERWVAKLPGITCHRNEPNTLLLNTKITRFYPRRLLYLLGFRKFFEQGGEHFVSRRQFDLEPPEHIEL
jgi:predicted deacylase